MKKDLKLPADMLPEVPQHQRRGLGLRAFSILVYDPTYRAYEYLYVTTQVAASATDIVANLMNVGLEVEHIIGLPIPPPAPRRSIH